MEYYEAKRAGVIPVLFGTCARCGGVRTWDIRRQRCVACEFHAPTGSLRAWRLAKGLRGEALVKAPRKELVVVTVQVPAHAQATDVFANLCRSLLDIYGGYSKTIVQGAWRNAAGMTVVEQMVRFEIAMTTDAARTFRDCTIHAIRSAFEQDAIYHTEAGHAWVT